MSYRWAIPETIPGNFILGTSMLCVTFALHLLAAAAALYLTTTLL